MDVVDLRRAAARGSPPRAELLDDRRRHGEADERQPRGRRQDKPDREQRERDEDQDAEARTRRGSRRRARAPAASTTPRGRRGSSAGRPPRSEDQLVAAETRASTVPMNGDRQAQGGRRPRRGAGRADRLGDELPDRPLSGGSAGGQRLPVGLPVERSGGGRLGRVGLLEDELAVPGVHANGVALGELALEQPQRERVLEQALDRALQRPRAVGRSQPASASTPAPRRSARAAARARRAVAHALRAAARRSRRSAPVRAGGTRRSRRSGSGTPAGSLGHRLGRARRSTS